MHEPFTAPAPAARPRARLRRVRAILARLLPPPAYGETAIGLTLSDEARKELRFFSGLLTALPVSILIWVAIMGGLTWAIYL